MLLIVMMILIKKGINYEDNGNDYIIMIIAIAMVIMMMNWQ